MTKHDTQPDLFKWAGVPTAWDLVELALAGGATRVFLWGPPAVGKSYAALGFGKTPLQVTLNEDLCVPDLCGHWVPSGFKFVWHDGPVCRAVRSGMPLVLNEVGRASGAVQDFLLGVLDHPMVCRLTLPSGETLTPAPGFVVIATSNSGPEALDPALKSRFEAIVHLSSPAPGLVQKLNTALPGLGDALLDSFKDPGRALDARNLEAFLTLRASGLRSEQASLLIFGEAAPDVLAALRARGVRV